MQFKISLRFLILLNILILIHSITAANKYYRYKKPLKPVNPIASSIIVDAKTGEILHFENADKAIYPASLAKLMTLYLTFEAIENGKLRLNQYVPVSYNAAHMPPSKLDLKEREMVKVKDLIMALIIKSANDAAVVLAETISGSEALFVKKMNIRAKQLGMYNTSFKNSSGWHHNEQRTSAMDLAKLGIALNRDFPKFYRLFSETKFSFKGRTIYTHNHLTKYYVGAEGMKTGYTRPSGYNLVTAATKNGRQLIGVITGSSSAKQRDNEMTILLNKHFGIRSKIIQKQDIKRKDAIKKQTAQAKKSRKKPRKTAKKVSIS